MSKEKLDADEFINQISTDSQRQDMLNYLIGLNLKVVLDAIEWVKKTYP